ncbi:hypothetical protein [Blastococcus haudaquaticus]|uniref:Uncharacterized protein n=1 Tax=Blastococcus haudaquaticus TaxID=1938745 RepID=A0A286GQE3_9ACTN|nr:hypothetical protein [Blastococcus haudaquaticus]SOD97743.1 hypothetical protein SAMN06272739_1602 [Blastococcus haudaquaticus]
MPIPDLELTARLVGLPIPELWSRYTAVGGSCTPGELAEHIAGRSTWPSREDLFLAVALNDALLDESLSPLRPLAGFLENEPSGAPATVADLEALIARARQTRASARLTRRWAQEVRARLAAPMTPAVGEAAG